MSEKKSLPRSLVIGPMKAGTTWIQEYLDWRGDVCLPNKVKETFFFDRYYARGDDWYARRFAHFDPSRHTSIIEVAPSLFHDPDAPARVHESLGPVPLVVMRRDPVARAWSHYQHMRRKGYTTAPLAEAVEAFPGIVTASRHDEMMERWRSALPDAAITVLEMEDLRGDREKFVAMLCGAFDLPVLDAPDDLQASNAAGVPKSYLVARIGSLTANTLRASGAYGVVNLAKKAGLKNVFFGKPSTAEQRVVPTEEERAFLIERVGARPDGVVRLAKEPGEDSASFASDRSDQ